MLCFGGQQLRQAQKQWIYSVKQFEESTLLDSFDMLAPAFDKPQSTVTVRQGLEQAGFIDIQVFRCGHLVGCGKKTSVQ